MVRDEWLLAEYTQLRQSERHARDLLHHTNTLAVAVVSGLLVAITVYEVKALVMVAPLVFYFVGAIYSSEALRLLRIRSHARHIEREVRQAHPTLPVGFEDATNPGVGLQGLVAHDTSVVVAPALFYAVFYALFFYLLAVSDYDLRARVWLIILYLVFGFVLWVPQLWWHQRMLLRTDAAPVDVAVQRLPNEEL